MLRYLSSYLFQNENEPNENDPSSEQLEQQPGGPTSDKQPKPNDNLVDKVEGMEGGANKNGGNREEYMDLEMREDGEEEDDDDDWVLIGEKKNGEEPKKEEVKGEDLRIQVQPVNLVAAPSTEEEDEEDEEEEESEEEDGGDLAPLKEEELIWENKLIEHPSMSVYVDLATSINSNGVTESCTSLSSIATATSPGESVIVLEQPDSEEEDDEDEYMDFMESVVHEPMPQLQVASKVILEDIDDDEEDDIFEEDEDPSSGSGSSDLENKVVTLSTFAPPPPPLTRTYAAVAASNLCKVAPPPPPPKPVVVSTSVAPPPPPPPAPLQQQQQPLQNGRRKKGHYPCTSSNSTQMPRRHLRNSGGSNAASNFINITNGAPDAPHDAIKRTKRNGTQVPITPASDANTASACGIATINGTAVNSTSQTAASNGISQKNLKLAEMFPNSTIAAAKRRQRHQNPAKVTPKGHFLQETRRRQDMQNYTKHSFVNNDRRSAVQRRVQKTSSGMGAGANNGGGRAK